MIFSALRVLMILLLPALFGACAKPTAADDFDDYLQRVARVVDADVPDWQAAGQQLIVSKYPGPKQRYLDTVESRVGLLDFLSLHDCGLLHLISERNSSLGKVMSDVARYYYEWLILRGLQHCLSNENFKSDDDEIDSFHQQLATVTDRKAAQINRHYWNASWGNAVLPQFFSLAQPVFQRSEMSGFKTPAIEALEQYFSQLPKPQPGEKVLDITETELSFFAASRKAEALLQPLQYHYGGRVLKSLAYATAALNAVTQLLQNRMDQLPLCYNRQPSRSAEVLQNVFIKYYVLQLQPFMSALEKEAVYLEYALGIGWANFQEKHSDRAGPVVGFYEDYFAAHNKQRLLEQMRDASKRHASA